MRRRSGGFIVLGCVLLLQGCGATERAAAVPYAITVDVAPDVNPDLNRKPSPIVLKVFQLKAASAFESADFFSLQDKPEGVLGADLLGVDRIILRPGEARTLHYRGNVEAGALGVVAEYRVLEKNRWRLTVPLPRAKQLNAYKFWQTSPGELKLSIAVRNGGIGLGGDARGRP
ncbi:type VI secretion lipofamily protein [Burkholderia ubonensis]|uniref:Type VI secretion lipofamily protein n=1 Tax=Burkholderia ubonensis TaxID=101571 RepID=A0A102JXD4_9BURK|nr:type VI secretion system lipoprotein TssJ [Burkholderia ubonensis]AOI73438.1 type VI secretion lipofamily protein [Burkholderia ubonensis]KUZ22099.1 type VI secretion lipofamily protein [Burkholderia ubonensis]KUZ28415.1 type VI secretion lipofamily protein [Burkholderia ubonensis]KUZ39818.1 type VI secretion lipofamily protein [Burkholderia ubonensis]KUZ49021.1 type VI secretion lipofamily protein [Burkholderia ubonensis]